MSSKAAYAPTPSDWFETYVGLLTTAIGHPDRAKPPRRYCAGRVLTPNLARAFGDVLGFGVWLPEGHLARFGADVVDELDLSAIEVSYEGEVGVFPPYLPRMLVRVLVYSYGTGIYSSQRIQKALADNVAFR